MITNIWANINKFEIKEKPDNGYGKRFEIVLHLSGENGKDANVLTAWIENKETKEIKLTSIYVTKKKAITKKWFVYTIRFY